MQDLPPSTPAEPAGHGRQWLLVMHASEPSIYAPLLGHTLHRPIPGERPPLTSEPERCPYDCVHAAVCDGWRVLQFPSPRPPSPDLSTVGYMFVLERIAPAPPASGADDGG